MRRVTGGAVLGLAAVVLAGCGSSHATTDKPFVQVPVELTASVPAPVKIGVIFSSHGEGSDWARSAGGSEVAAFRFTMGGAKVSIVALDDEGTAKQATADVHTLISDQVSGIVMASAGGHLEAAIAAASAAQTPVILPYYAPANPPAGVWSMAPTGDEVGAQLSAALTQLNRRSPLLIEADNQSVPGLRAANTVTFNGSDQSVIASRISELVKAGGLDSVVISGSAASQAAVAKVLQGWSNGTRSRAQQFSYPVLLTPNALSPVFATQLVKDRGVLDGTFTTVGVNTGQVAALAQTQQGAQLAAFYSAVQMAAATGSNTANGVVALNQQPFGVNDEIAADTQSHDAVVALVRAVVAAKSTSPSSVLAALHGLTLRAAQGLAGPSLSFATPQLLPSTAMVVLGSTSAGPNVLALNLQSDGSTSNNFVPLYWFALPGASNS